MLPGCLSRCPSSLCDHPPLTVHWKGVRTVSEWSIALTVEESGGWSVSTDATAWERVSDCILVDRVKWQWQVINIIGVLVFTSQPNPHQLRASPPTESHICYLLSPSSKLHSWMPPWHSLPLLHAPPFFVTRLHLFSVHCVRHTHTYFGCQYLVQRLTQAAPEHTSSHPHHNCHQNSSTLESHYGRMLGWEC